MPEYFDFSYEIGTVLEIKVKAEITNDEGDISTILRRGTKWEITNHLILFGQEQYYELKLCSDSKNPGAEYDTIKLLRSNVDSGTYFRIFDEASFQRRQVWHKVFRQVGSVPPNLVLNNNLETKH